MSFAIPAVGTLWLFYFRMFKMKSASKQLMAAKKKSKVTGYDTQSLKLTFKYFGPRLIATAGAWFANDVFFYGNEIQSVISVLLTASGNKLFQDQFINVPRPSIHCTITNLL